MTDLLPTRRELLAALGGTAAIAGIGSMGVVAAQLDPVSMTESSRVSVVPAQSDAEPALDLVVNWRATYNGQTLDEGAFGSPPEDLDGAIAFDLPSVHPGDSGTLITELHVPEDGNPAALWIAPSLEADRENEINEPEEKAGDETAGSDGGELAEALDVFAWYDVGTIGDIGYRNARHEPGEPVLGESSLRQFTSSGRRRLDAYPRTSGLDCLQPGESLPISLTWALPMDVGNAVQGDSVQFDVSFGVRSCSRGEPPSDPSVRVTRRPGQSHKRTTEIRFDSPEQ